MLPWIYIFPSRKMARLSMQLNLQNMDFYRILELLSLTNVEKVILIRIKEFYRIMDYHIILKLLSVTNVEKVILILM